MIDPEQRFTLVKSFAASKKSVMSTRWVTKSAALFASPNLIDVCLPLIAHSLELLAGLPPDVISVTIPTHTRLEELIPFVELDPPRYFSVLTIPPDDLRELSSFFACLRFAIPCDFDRPSMLSIFLETMHARDPILFRPSIIMFCVDVYQGFHETISSRSGSAVSALSIAFNRDMPVQLVKLFVRMPITSPDFRKALVYFVTEMDFDGILESDRLLNHVIDKFWKIS
jgi:hypothetical protein